MINGTINLPPACYNPPRAVNDIRSIGIPSTAPMFSPTSFTWDYAETCGVTTTTYDPWITATTTDPLIYTTATSSANDTILGAAVNLDNTLTGTTSQMWLPSELAGGSILLPRNHRLHQ